MPSEAGSRVHEKAVDAGVFCRCRSRISVPNHRGVVQRSRRTSDVDRLQKPLSSAARVWASLARKLSSSGWKHANTNQVSARSRLRGPMRWFVQSMITGPAALINTLPGGRSPCTGRR
jgi:hypothetical protein